MDADALLGLLTSVESGEVSPDEAVRRLSRLPFADLGAARIDHHRALRQGLPEAVYGPGKSPDDVAVVVAELLEHGTGPVVLSRADEDQVTKALGVDPSGIVLERTVVWRRAAARPDRVLVVTAGTADGPVADECAAVLWAHGLEPDRLIDVGVYDFMVDTLSAPLTLTSDVLSFSQIFSPCSSSQFAARSMSSAWLCSGGAGRGV